jgi:hypothetical protein
MDHGFWSDSGAIASRKELAVERADDPAVSFGHVTRL